MTSDLGRKALAVLATFAALLGPDLPAGAQQAVPVTQDIPRMPAAAPPRDPSQIAGIRIDGNGALITGPLDHRRVYIPLDKPIVPSAFFGLWAGTPAVCVAAAASRTDSASTPDGSLVIGKTAIVGRKRMTILQTFVPLPATLTMAMLDSGRPLVLPAGKYRGARKVLVTFALPDGQRDYREIGILQDGKTLELQKGNGNETATRCPN